MGYLGRFRTLTLERKLLVIFTGICIALPFSIASIALSPWKIFLYAAPLWIYFHGGVSLWFASGKPLWQTALACYGVSSAEILGIYFGTFGLRLLTRKGSNWLKIKLQKGIRLPFSNQFLVLKERVGYHKFNSFTEDKKTRFIGWLEKQSIWVILFFLLIPIPVTDILATVTLGTKGLKYGHWYLVAVNLPHIFLVVYLLKLGVTFLFL